MRLPAGFPVFPSPDPRIYCLMQSTDAHPGLAAGVAPEGLLSPAEQSRYEGFKVFKRRRDWLLGRWTAKHLVQSFLALRQGEPVALERIEILANEDGAPFARLGERLPLSLSISHSGSESFCAVCEREVGADLEQIEPRELSFVRTFFTPTEISAVEAAAPLERDALITALWSTKEAVLKALRLGLRADTRQIDLQVTGLASEWQPVKVSAEPALLPSASTTVSAWSQVQSTRVLSLALLITD